LVIVQITSRYVESFKKICFNWIGEIPDFHPEMEPKKQTFLLTYFVRVLVIF